MIEKYFIGLMKINMKENIKMVRKMIEECIIGLMEIDMKEITKILRRMVKKCRRRRWKSNW